jgi:hypothetical protein
LKEYVFQVEGGPHLLQSCLRAAQDSLPLAIKKMHLSFESLAVTNAPNLYVFFMDIHQNTSFRFILEDDSISLQEIMVYLIRKLNKKPIILTI